MALLLLQGLVDPAGISVPSHPANFDIHIIYQSFWMRYRSLSDFNVRVWAPFFVRLGLTEEILQRCLASGLPFAAAAVSV
jgi:hypothetical protein